ncbi:C-GCAxxG-C-C family protein, partial [Clostridium saudiense]|nr:C-GCAxxG-C-C family protein [Clostridium saudiense]
YYRNGDFFCSEAIVKTIKDEFELPVSDEIVAAASGFPIGIGGSGCTCGAVSGGVMALGLVFGRQEAKDPKVRKTMELTKELHEKFRKNHKSLCCRILTKGLDMGSGEHKEQCISFTGEVAEEVAKIIVRELNNNNLLNHVGV